VRDAPPGAHGEGERQSRQWPWGWAWGLEGGKDATAAPRCRRACPARRRYGPRGPGAGMSEAARTYA